MDNSREMDSIWATIQRSSGGVAMAVMLSARMSFQLMTYLYRLVQKGLLATKVADNFKNFSKLTEGKFTVYNIPLPEEHAKALYEMNQLETKLQTTESARERKAVEKEIASIKKEIPELKELDKLKITYCALPKLNGAQTTIQVAVADKDEQLFKSWYLNHLTMNLSGGEKGMEELRAFTEGNCTIFNLPMEGEELTGALADFDVFGINYAVLPDLNVGDGNSQVSVANADQGKVEMWARLWKEKQLADGKTPGSIYKMDEDSYLSTGHMQAEDYIEGSEEKYRQVNQEFEEKSSPVPWNGTLGKENSQEFVNFLKNDNYEKITINRETLVENMDVSAKAQEMQKNGYFISRLPGTYGDNQKTLLLPTSQVFATDDGKTFVAFLAKNEPLLVADKDGKLRHNSFSDVKGTYDKVERGFQKVEKIAERKPDLQITPPLSPAPAAPKL